ncbi:MAG: 16S rRNA (cytosine(1402)-N(4))-methyltransferase RsmH [Defluviitaleaceae bacterium]|nr:16S rRNA (cytosine(1402)-N(4))-methyltransferase RsmH [Defluviitaleaceae bacterium]
MKFKHLPVLPNEVIENLAVAHTPDGIFLDGTCGGGGHSHLLAEHLSAKGRLICVDRDIEAINAAKNVLQSFTNVQFVHNNYNNIIQVLETLDIDGLNGVLLDLGVSSYQLDNPDRGFSFLHAGRLDMRMDASSGLSAADVVNTYSEINLRQIISDYGEERFAGRIAANIVTQRNIKPFSETTELADLVEKAIPRRLHEAHKHPATRTFQAIRIEVNNELKDLSISLQNIVSKLFPSGRFCVITFHSLEDRIVKNTFAELADPCKCPKTLPYCVCGKEPIVKLITRKPIIPTDNEISDNTRARSSKLRVIEKL